MWLNGVLRRTVRRLDVTEAGLAEILLVAMFAFILGLLVAGPQHRRPGGRLSRALHAGRDGGRRADNRIAEASSRTRDADATEGGNDFRPRLLLKSLADSLLSV